MDKIENIDEWHKIGNELCNFLGWCTCQRKLKSIVDSFYNIYIKHVETSVENKEIGISLSGSDYIIIAMLDRGHVNDKTSPITHGTNIEYPIINKEHIFWKMILKLKDNPYLQDN